MGVSKETREGMDPSTFKNVDVKIKGRNRIERKFKDLGRQKIHLMEHLIDRPLSRKIRDKKMHLADRKARKRAK